jgi:hypothetical protein
MAIEEITGTETIGTTEWSLATDTSYSSADAQTTDGVVQAFIDCNALAAGDQYRVRMYEVCRSGDTQRIAHAFTITGAQSEPLCPTPALTFMHGWDITVTKLAGTDRAINWSIRRIPVA